MTPLQLKSRISARLAAETDTDKLELVLKWLESPTRAGTPHHDLVKAVLRSEMEHLEGKGMTPRQARASAKRSIRRGKRS
jgi:hypothetical protein